MPHDLDVCSECPFHEYRKTEGRTVCLATPEHKNIVHQAREGCPYDFFNHPASEASTDTIISLIASGMTWTNWHLWPNVQAAYRHLCAKAIAAIPPCPNAGAGRGIVVVGGGRYFISALTNIRLVRKLGCTLPIMLAGLDGELPSWQRELVGREGVACATWSELAPAHPRGKEHGWELKTVVALFSPFAQTLILDADSFPQRDPTFLFDLPQFAETGAVFWPDLPDPKRQHNLGDNMPPEVWEMLGVPVRDIWAIESGQQLIDKARWWRGLWLSNWLCQKGWEFYYKFWYGDKNNPQVASVLLDLPYAMPEHRPYTGFAGKPCGSDCAPMLLQRDFDGAPLFGHYTRPKWWSDWNDRAAFKDIPQDALCIEIFKQARYDFWHKQPKPFIVAITVCIGYEDFLEATIANRQHVDDWLIVTVAGDPAAELCRKHGLWHIESDKLHLNGSKFNLGALRNEGAAAVAAKYAGRDDIWALYLDADCLLPTAFRREVERGDLDHRYLIGAHRHHVDGTSATDVNVTGYFQLFHLSQFPAKRYREDHANAGQTDIWFREQWRSYHLLMLPLTVEHLGITGTDWEGRTSPGIVVNNPTVRKVKVYGLQRTGTNLAAWLLEQNFAAEVLGEGEEGWKHGQYVAGAWSDDARFILCTRHPLAHLASLWKYCQREHGHDKTMPPQFEPGMSFAEFLASPCYQFESPVHRWSTMYRSWLDDLPMERTVIVRQEDQLGNQAQVLHRTRLKLGLSVKASRWTTTDNRIEVGAVMWPLNAEPADLSIYTDALLKQVESKIDPEVMRRLGYAESVREPLTVRRVIHGAIGLTKAALHIDRAPEEVITQRKTICGACEHHKGGKCDICGCALAAKQVIRSEHCPDSPPRWLAFPPP